MHRSKYDNIFCQEPSCQYKTSVTFICPLNSNILLFLLLPSSDIIPCFLNPGPPSLSLRHKSFLCKHHFVMVTLLKYLPMKIAQLTKVLRSHKLLIFCLLACSSYIVCLIWTSGLLCHKVMEGRYTSTSQKILHGSSYLPG